MTVKERENKTDKERFHSVHPETSAADELTGNRSKIRLSAQSVSATEKRHGREAEAGTFSQVKERLRRFWRALFPPLPPVKHGGERPMAYYMFKCLFLKYCSKKGRASRKELWSFALLTTLLQMLVFYLFFIRTEDYLRLVWWLNFISAATLLPSVMLIIRRVHDFNKSGWSLFVPTYKIILFAFIKGDAGANKFGAPE